MSQKSGVECTAVVSLGAVMYRKLSALLLLLFPLVGIADITLSTPDSAGSFTIGVSTTETQSYPTPGGTVTVFLSGKVYERSPTGQQSEVWSGSNQPATSIQLTRSSGEYTIGTGSAHKPAMAVGIRPVPTVLKKL